MMSIKKSTSGRQRIPIEKIAKKSHLQVTFSKRRSGLFKKASELCTLCGVEIAIIVFSPADKAFSFGHPGVESLIDCYLAQNSPSELSSNHQLVEAHRNANARNLNMQLTQILHQLEIEKKLGEELDHARKLRQKQFWWEIPIDELGLYELQHLMLSMEELKKNVGKYGSKMMLMEQSPQLFGLVPNEFGLYENKPGPAEIYASSSAVANTYNLCSFMGR